MTYYKETVIFNSIEDVDKWELKHNKLKPAPLMKEILLAYPKLCLGVTCSVHNYGTPEESRIPKTHVSVTLKADPTYQIATISQYGSRYVNGAVKREYQLQHSEISNTYREKRSTKVSEIMKVLKRLGAKGTAIDSEEKTIYSPEAHDTYIMEKHINKVKKKAMVQCVGENNTYKDPEEIASMIAQGYEPATNEYKKAIMQYKENFRAFESKRSWFPTIYHVFKNNVTEKFSMWEYKSTLGSKSSYMTIYGSIILVSADADKGWIAKEVCEEELPDFISRKISVMEIADEGREYPIAYEDVGIQCSPNRWWVIADE